MKRSCAFYIWQNTQNHNKTNDSACGKFKLINNGGTSYYFGQDGAIYKNNTKIKQSTNVNILKQAYKKYWKYYVKPARFRNSDALQVLAHLYLVTETLIAESKLGISKEIKELVKTKSWFDKLWFISVIFYVIKRWKLTKVNIAN